MGRPDEVEKRVLAAVGGAAGQSARS
jgi:hypothetical protein